MTNIEELMPYLAVGYEEKCREFKVIERKRIIKEESAFMKLCLFHLLEGSSLIETSEISRMTGIGKISDVAFMKKFKKCAEWFAWIAEQMMPGIFVKYQKPEYLERYCVKAFDATDVVEKGRSGQLYHIHYGVDIFKMRTTDHKITKQKVGEKLCNFKLEKGDLAIADRAYGTIGSIRHCLDSEAEYILRLRSNGFKIYDEEGEVINLLDKFSQLALKEDECGEIAGAITLSKDVKSTIRICVKRKSEKAYCDTRKRLLRRQSKKGKKLQAETLDFNRYIVVVTSLPADISSEQILEAYRYRWQIENLFKRLKSIMNVGELPKKDEQASLSWLNGKIMLAIMTELLLSKASFPPCSDSSDDQKCLERDEITLANC